MPERRVSFHPEAVADAREARLWYAEIDPRLADDFVAQLDLAIARIATSPLTWPTSGLRTRRYLMHRFPYAIIYRVHGEEVQVLAVAHGHRRPGYWRKR
jgi:plasmid stabilization system protein ParE